MRASSGQPFFAGDALRVGPEGAAEVALPDGSRVLMRADSLLRFVAAGDAAAARLYLERGAAEVEAAPQSPDRPLVVVTKQARLTVLGTQFRLYASDADSRVELEEGKVQFQRQSDGHSVEVAAGQYAIAAADSEPAEPLAARPLHAGWRMRQTLLRAGSRAAFSHEGSRLATASNNYVKVWEVSTGELQHVVDKVGRFTCLAFTPSDEAIVALSDGGKAMYWPIGEAPTQQTELKTTQGQLRRCAVSNDGRWLAQTTSANAGDLPIWQVDDTGAISLVRSIPMKMGSVAIAATSQGPQVVASVWHGTTVKWDAETGKELARFPLPSQLHVLTLSADGRLVCGYGNTTGLLVLDTETGEQRTLWPSGSVRVTWLRVSRDGREVFAAMADGLVRGWLTGTGEPTLVLATGDARVASLDVSPDGRHLATAGDKGSVKIWQREE